jgi:hypothetical protein
VLNGETEGQGLIAQGIKILLPQIEFITPILNVSRNNMNVILGMTDQPWGSREFRLLHPDGHTLRINAVL